MDKLLKPLSQNNGLWIVYEIDDLMSDKYIPLFNRGRKSFEGEHIQSNIKHLLEQADIITVTTDYIKETYHRIYGIPLEKIVALPNFLPKYLFDDRYDLQRKVDQFRRYKAKPRIGIVSSLSHYNIDGIRMGADGRAVRSKVVGKDGSGNAIVKWFNEGNMEIPESETKVIEDDMDTIIDCVMNTVNDFQWVFFGYCPPRLSELARKKKIEVYGCVPIMNYASMMDRLQLQAVVAPIRDIEFNRCKSFIKYMECAALGIPLLASNALPYNRVMNKRQLFNDASELREKLLEIKFASVGWYQKLIEGQYKWLNTPCKEGDFKIKNFWLEDNLGIFIDLFRMRNKCIDMSLGIYLDKKEERENWLKEHALYADNNGVEILK